MKCPASIKPPTITKIDLPSRLEFGSHRRQAIRSTPCAPQEPTTQARCKCLAPKAVALVMAVFAVLTGACRKVPPSRVSSKHLRLCHSQGTFLSSRCNKRGPKQKLPTSSLRWLSRSKTSPTVHDPSSQSLITVRPLVGRQKNHFKLRRP